MMEESGWSTWKCQNLEMELDKLLEASFLPPGNKEKIQHLFKEDVKKHNLGMKSFLKEQITIVRFTFTFLYLCY